MQANRETYHHGDLRHALVEVGMELCRDGGPDAVTMREATRAAGVTVNAAYRHFDGLGGYLDALSQECLSRLAVRMEADAGDASGEALLRAVGTSYIGFALDEPGWFATAFLIAHDMSFASSPAAAGASGRTPFALLTDALDQMVEAGALRPERRAGADVFCWSTVHGFGQLAVFGPLRGLPRPAQEAAAAAVVDAAIRGVLA